MVNKIQGLIGVGGTDPITSGAIEKSRGPLDNTADIRDSILALVGKGVSSLNDEDSQGHFAKLSGILGQKQAQALVTHIILQNKRPEFQGLSPRSRISKFYEIGSSNTGVSNILQTTKAFGSGPLAGFQDSGNVSNQKLSGTYTANPDNANQKDADIMNKKIMLKVVKNK